jgi:hypothetical protein
MSDAEDAAENVVDPHRLLPGESEDSTDPAEIANWTAVYDDLLRFKSDLLDSIRAGLGDRLPEVRHEIERVDLVALEAQLRRIRDRRDFWKRRLSPTDRR